MPLNEITLTLRERLVIALVVNKQEASILRNASKNNSQLEEELKDLVEDGYDATPLDYLEEIDHQFEVYSKIRKEPKLLFTFPEIFSKESIRYALGMLAEENPFVQAEVDSLIRKLDTITYHHKFQN